MENILLRRCVYVSTLISKSSLLTNVSSQMRGFGPHVRQNILFLRFGHEKVSSDILSLPQIQKGQLSVTGEGMGTKYSYETLTDICLTCFKIQYRISTCLSKPENLRLIP